MKETVNQQKQREKLEYIGKESSGGWFPMSSAAPSDLYYYGTDMSVEEVASYFPDAKLSTPLQKSSEYASLDFVTPSEKKVTVNIYLDKKILKLRTHPIPLNPHQKIIY